jgi:hypothetical protein
MILFMAYIAMVIDLTTILFKPHPLIQNKVKLQIRGFLCLQNLVFLFWWDNDYGFEFWGFGL